MYGVQSLSGSEPGLTGPQAPSSPAPLRAAVQARHGPVQAESQHTPSTQKPLTHWLFWVQATPLPSRQAPAPLHWFAPTQPGASGAVAGVLAQVPTVPGKLHAWQTPEQAALQQ